MTLPTRQEIINLSLQNPWLEEALQPWHNGHCTFEQAMMSSTMFLTGKNNELRTKVSQLLSRLKGALP